MPLHPQHGAMGIGHDRGDGHRRLLTPDRVAGQHQVADHDRLDRPQAVVGQHGGAGDEAADRFLGFGPTAARTASATPARAPGSSWVVSRHGRSGTDGSFIGTGGGSYPRPSRLPSGFFTLAPRRRYRSGLRPPLMGCCSSPRALRSSCCRCGPPSRYPAFSNPVAVVWVIWSPTLFRKCSRANVSKLTRPCPSSDGGRL